MTDAERSEVVAELRALDSECERAEQVIEGVRDRISFLAGRLIADGESSTPARRESA